MVGQEDRPPVLAQPHGVGILLAGQFGRAEARADLDALDRIDRHHRRRQFGVQLAIERRAPAGGQARDLQRHHRPDRRAGLAHAVEIRLPVRDDRRRGREQGVVVDRVEIHRLRRYAVRPELDHSGADADPLAEHLACHRPRRDPHRRLAGRGPAAAAVVADAVFGLVGVVGMAGPEGAGDLAIVLRPGVLILDLDGDGRAGGDRAVPVVEHAGQDAGRVALLPLGDEAAAARLAPVQPGLQVGLRQGDQRRAAVDDAADRRPVALAPGRHAKQMAEAVVGHRTT